jgi:C-5 cytosine-specific DNA methylase
MKILDLFCCCGGASTGLSDSGKNKIVGVDVIGNHNYPFEFIKSDVFKLEESFFNEFDFIWASPPCQFYIPTNKYKDTRHPDFIPITRELLLRAEKPFVIENVPGAPIRKDLMLCGEMFSLKIIRHRLFEIHGFTVLNPEHKRHKLSVMNGTAIGCYSGGINPGFYGDKDKQKAYRERRKTIRPSSDIKDWQDALGVNWVNDKTHLTQMIPPAYSNYIIRNLVLGQRTG